MESQSGDPHIQFQSVIMTASSPCILSTYLYIPNLADSIDNDLQLQLEFQ